MNKIKYLAAIAIGIAGLGLQQARADFVSTLNMSNGQGAGNYGTVTVSNFNAGAQTATITFNANTAAGFYFIDGGAAAVNLNGNSGTGSNVSESPVNNFKNFTYHANNDGFGQFTVRLNNKSASVHVSQIVFTVTNTSGTTLWTSESDVLAFNSQGWDASAHYIDTFGTGLTYFAGEGHGTIPDGGTTVMLLGAALGALGMVRRYLAS